MEVAGVEEGATTEERMEGTTRAEAAGLLPTFLLHLLLRQRRRESRRRERERERAKALSSTSFSLVEKKKKTNSFFLSLPLFSLSPSLSPCALYPFSQLTAFFIIHWVCFYLVHFFFSFSFFFFARKKKVESNKKSEKLVFLISVLFPSPFPPLCLGHS